MILWVRPLVYTPSLTFHFLKLYQYSWLDKREVGLRGQEVEYIRGYLFKYTPFNKCISQIQWVCTYCIKHCFFRCFVPLNKTYFSGRKVIIQYCFPYRRTRSNSWEVIAELLPPCNTPWFACIFSYIFSYNDVFLNRFWARTFGRMSQETNKRRTVQLSSASATEFFDEDPVLILTEYRYLSHFRKQIKTTLALELFQ